MTAQPTSHHLDVPGGNLYYEVRGSGPLLLVIGQPMTSAPSAPWPICSRSTTPW